MELSSNNIKFISSLAQKKYRVESGCFVAEGNKIVRDTMHLFQCEMIVATERWIMNNYDSCPNTKVIEARADQIKRISQMKTPQEVVAVYRLPQYELDLDEVRSQLVLVLDGVQDPGNMGTIIRTADWYGIKNIVCSKDSVDAFNPKVVQATMGALARVKVHYINLDLFFSSISDVPVYGTLLEGNNIYNELLPKSGLVIFGNEGRGISEAIKEYITNPITIPNYPLGVQTSESLNVSAAAAIVISEFRRQAMK